MFKIFVNLITLNLRTQVIADLDVVSNVQSAEMVEFNST